MIVDIQSGDTLFSTANDVGASWKNSVVLRGSNAYPMIYGQGSLPRGGISPGDEVFLGAGSPIIVDGPTTTLYSIGVANSMKWQHLKVFRPSSPVINMRGGGYMPSSGSLLDAGSISSLKLGDYIYVPYKVGCNCGEETTSSVAEAEQAANMEASGQDVEAVSQECNQKRVIVIDPGHGGDKKVGGSSSNNAKSSSGVLEKDLALKYAKVLKEKLESPEVLAIAEKHGCCDLKIVLTRETDVNLGIGARRSVAIDNSADIFLPFHFNGSTNKNNQGTEVYYRKPQYGGQSNLSDDQRLCQIVNKAIYDGIKEIHPQAKNRGVKDDYEDRGARNSEGKLTGIGLTRDAGVGLSGKKCRVAYIEFEFITHPIIDKLFVSGETANQNIELVMARLASALVMELG